MAFLQSKPLISLATGYTDGQSNIGRELDLSAFVYEPIESEVDQSEDAGGLEQALGTQLHLLHHLDLNRGLFSRMQVLVKMFAEVTVK